MNGNADTNTMKKGEDNEAGAVPTPDHKKRKIGYWCFDEKNVYMEDINIRRRRLLGDDSGSDESDSSSESDNSSDEEGPGDERRGKVRKRGRRKRRLHWSKSPEKDAKYADWKIEVRYYPTTSTTVPPIEKNNDPGGDTGGVGDSEENTNDAKESKTDMNDVDLLDSPQKATEAVTYSVHRSTLGVQSEYFERIFLGGYSESTQQKNSIELPAPLVTLDHFETVLEYCYTETLALTPENVVSIIHLSDYLGIEELRKKSQSYVRGAIHQVIANKGRRFLGSSKEKVAMGSSKESKEKSNKVAMFYQAANILGLEDLQRAIVHVCSKEPQLLAKDCRLADMPDIEFWSRLWEARKIHPDQNSLSNPIVRLWSENLANFFDKHTDIADLDTFRKLTHIDSLPIVSPEVAILLMQQEHRLCLEHIQANVYLVNKSDKEDALTCLQSRCIEALYNSKTRGWQISTPPDVIRGKLRKLPSIVLESILLKTMEYERAGQRFPMPVVSGAGSDFVNGVYKMSGWFKNAMKFTRWGIYEGNPREFTLYRYEGEWWISIIPEHHDEPGDCDDIDFYSFDKLDQEANSESPLPPATGWTTCCGESPAPTVHLLSQDEADNDNGNDNANANPPN